MGQQDKSALSQIVDQFTSPWDWVAGAVGALAGFGLTIATGGADLGTFTAGGATAGVTVKKAAVASLHGWRLKKQARGFKSQIEKHSAKIPALEEISISLEAELSLWEDGATSNEDFAKQLYLLIEEYRKTLTKYARENQLFKQRVPSAGPAEASIS